MKIEQVNIGLAIEQRLNELDISKAEFGRRIGIPNQNINRILEKSSINTDKLAAISEALDYNFFAEYVDDEAKVTHKVETRGDYSPASLNGNVSVGADAVLQERVRMLEALLAEKERVIRLYEELRGKV